jgi:hypothetical protein
VLFAQKDHERKPSPVSQRQHTEHGIPHEQREPGTEHRPEENRILSNGFEEAACRKA